MIGFDAYVLTIESLCKKIKEWSEIEEKEWPRCIECKYAELRYRNQLIADCRYTGKGNYLATQEGCKKDFEPATGYKKDLLMALEELEKNREDFVQWEKLKD